MMDLFGGGASLAWGPGLGTLGLGYFMYGKKLQKMVPLACGLALMVLPYFVSNTTALAVSGGVLGLAPWLVRG